MADHPQHSPGFLRLVQSVRERVREMPALGLAQALAQTPGAVLIDVREDREFAAGHVQGARHLGRGVIERDIEALYPDPATPLYLYCGGGFRSALAADSLQRMGYTQVVSVDGGWRALKDLMPVSGG